MERENDDYQWSPLSVDYLISTYGIRDKKVIGVLTGWIFLTILLVYITVLSQQFDMIQLSVKEIDFLSIIAFNPVYILGILLLLWVGFEWSFIPVYVSTFVAILLSGVTVFWSTLISLAFVLGLVFFALVYHSFRVSYSLRSVKSFTLFIIIAFLAALASSLGSFIWSYSHELSAPETLIYWKRWWTGTFFQSILVAIPVLYIMTPGVERLKSRFFSLPVQKEVSIVWVYGAIVTVAVTMFVFIFSSYMLGRASLSQFIRERNITAAGEILSALEAFEIIAWTSIAIIGVTAAAALYLIHNWNYTLRKEVEVRTQELNESREDLQQSLREKEILFKEIQHRVKNNLAQVHGLLELQETMSDKPEVSDLLKVSKSRIRTMSLAHEALYNSEDFSNISLKEYLQSICDITHISYKNSSKELNLVYDIDDFNIDMSKAIPLGLMITEILINAHKHAFTGKNSGLIEIESKIDGDHMTLTIKDNGIGLPQDVDIRKSNSLGMFLVESFSQQLNAEYDIKSSLSGTSFSFKIPMISIHG